MFGLFKKKTETKQAQYAPRCAECEKYRDMIQIAVHSGNPKLADDLRVEMANHCATQHGNRK